jgi:hypothetical protein
MLMTKEKTSFSLSPEAKKILKGLSDRWGINQSAVLEILLRGKQGTDLNELLLESVEAEGVK